MSFDAYTGYQNETVTIHLSGDLTDDSAPFFKSALDGLAGRPVRRLLLEMRALQSISAAAIRTLMFAQQQLGGDVEVIVVGAGPDILHALDIAGFGGSGTIAEESAVNSR